MQVDSTRFASYAPPSEPGEVLPRPPRAVRALRPIAVTGTNGKTTTTTWIAAALARARTTPVMRATTTGYFLGEEALGLPADYDTFLDMMEYAALRGGRDVVMELTSKALLRGYGSAFPAEVAVFTNLTHDHLDNHVTPEGYLHAKSRLFSAMKDDGTAVLNARDDAARLLAQRVPARARILTYGVPTRGPTWCIPDVEAFETRTTWSGTELSCVAGSAFARSAFVMRTRAVGDIYAENALAALTAAVAAGVELDVAIEAIGAAPAPPGRFEVVSRKPYVVVDYAHTPDALARTIAAARRLALGKLTVVFGAGGERDAGKRESMGAAASIADGVVITSDNPRGEDPREIAAAISRGLIGMRDVRIELDRKRAIELAIAGAGREDVVLVCGKGHEEVQIVGAKRIPFSDRAAIRDALRGRS